MSLSNCRIVLVRPKIAANIGATARIMRNMGIAHLVLVAPEADRDDRHLDIVLAQAYRINPDGKFTEYWALADDQDAVNAFWS